MNVGHLVGLEFMTVLVEDLLVKLHRTIPFFTPGQMVSVLCENLVVGGSQFDGLLVGMGRIVHPIECFGGLGQFQVNRGELFRVHFTFGADSCDVLQQFMCLAMGTRFQSSIRDHSCGFEVVRVQIMCHFEALNSLFFVVQLVPPNPSQFGENTSLCPGIRFHGDLLFSQADQLDPIRPTS